MKTDDFTASAAVVFFLLFLSHVLPALSFCRETFSPAKFFIVPSCDGKNTCDLNHERTPRLDIELPIKNYKAAIRVYPSIITSLLP